MKRYLALLRGINVSGQKIIKMDILKKSLTEIGLHNVQTYIQSGNIVFDYPEIEEKILATIIHERILNTWGYEIVVILLSREVIQKMLLENPYKNEDKKDLYMTILSLPPEQGRIESISNISFSPDTFFVLDKTIYIHCPSGYGKTKLSNTFFEKKLKISATTRNLNTMQKLWEMMQ